LPQAVNAAAAIREANRSDLFICVLSEKCRSTITGKGDLTPPGQADVSRNQAQRARAPLEPAKNYSKS
jgi:hypothetical protein